MSTRYAYNSVLVVVLLTFPYIASAQGNVCTDDEDNPVVCNPLEAESIICFLSDVVDAIVTLSIPVIALAIIYTGFLFVTAGGSDEQLDTAKSAAMYTAIGAGIIIGADVILAVLQNTASGLGVGGINESSCNT